MSVVERPAESMTEQAVNALQSFSPMVDQVLSYANFTVAVDGIGKVEEAHKAVKRLRVDLDKKRKELNEGALSYQRTVNATAKILTEKISVVELKLEDERAVYDAEKLKEKQAKEAAKAAILNERVGRLSGAGIVVTDIAVIGALAADEFEFYFAKELRIATEAKAEAERLETLRQEEIRRQSEELRVRAEEVERQRLADEAAMAEERAKHNAERVKQALLEAEERKANDERLRIEREAIEADRAEMRRQQEELTKHQAEMRAKAESEASEKRRIEKETEQARREAAAKPELEKLSVVLKAMTDAADLKIVELGEPAWGNDLVDNFNRFSTMMNQIVLESL